MTERFRKKYVTDENGKHTAVVLNIKTFDELMEEIDELNCALGYNEAVKETEANIQKGNYLSLDEYIAKRKSRKVLKHKSKA